MHKVLPAVGFYMPAVVYLGIFCMQTVYLSYILINRNPKKNFLALLGVFGVSYLRVLVYIFVWDIASIPMYIYGELQIFLFGMIAIYYLDLNVICQKKIINFVFLMYLVTAVTTYIGCTRYPNASRMLATLSQGEGAYGTYVSNNIGGFTFIYELVLILPLFMYLTKFNIVNRFIGIFIIVFIGMTIIKTQYTTALIMYVVSLLVLCIPKLSAKKIRTVFIVALVLIVANMSLLISFFEEIGSKVESEIFSSRFDYVSDVLSGETSDVEGGGNRVELYKKSWDTFVNTWLMGNWSNDGKGGHSFFFDSLATYGIIGFMLMILMYTTLYKCFIKPYKNGMAYPYILWSYMMGMVLAVLNPKTYMFIYLVVLPLFGNVYLENERISNDECLMDSK